MKQLDAFIQQYFDQPNVGDTDANKGQCVGLIEVWTDIFNLSHTWGNAKDLLTAADPNSFDSIQNSSTNFPVPGDIMVFGSAWGNGLGHTGIVIAANGNEFSLFEQNNPEGHTPQILTHEYDTQPNGTLGWLHIKNIPQDTTEADLQACLTQHDALVTQYNEKDATIANLNNLTKQKDAQISQLQGSVSSLESQVTSGEQALAASQEVAKQVPPLTTELEQAKQDRSVCLSAQTSQNQLIANLKQQIANGKPKTFWSRFQYLFSK